MHVLAGRVAVTESAGCLRRTLWSPDVVLTSPELAARR